MVNNQFDDREPWQQPEDRGFKALNFDTSTSASEIISGARLGYLREQVENFEAVLSEIEQKSMHTGYKLYSYNPERFDAFKEQLVRFLNQYFPEAIADDGRLVWYKLPEIRSQIPGLVNLVETVEQIRDYKREVVFGMGGP